MVAEPINCPALFLCAPESGQGKTTITCGLARSFANRGLTVHTFKTGPDYLDPQLLACASGHRATQLDLWMAGEASCRDLLYRSAKTADVILIEGVMGMFDGTPSSADLAALFGIPVAIVIDGSSMAQTFGAIAQGLYEHRKDLHIAGIIANNLGSNRHAEIVADSVPEHIPLLGCIQRSDQLALPERHLGLLNPNEVTDIENRLDTIAAEMGRTGTAVLPNAVPFSPGQVAAPPRLLSGVRIGIARDPAFSFIYAANLHLLEQMGAICEFFSPINDEHLPQADAIWLPGGYPELHAAVLSSNQSMMNSIRDFNDRGGKILAECGGMLYIMESLIDLAGITTGMIGLIPGNAVMQDRGGCQGMQTAPLSVGDIRAHAHHRTRCENTLAPTSFGIRARHPAPGEAIFETGSITASYLHLYFPSNPKAVAGIFSACAPATAPQ